MSHSQGNDTEALSPRYLHNKFRFETLWQAYLPAMAYDLVYSSMSLGTSSTNNTRRCLLDVTNNLPRVTADRHPCANSSVVITGAWWNGQLFYDLAYSSIHFLADGLKICGLFNVTYIPGSKKVENLSSLSPPVDRPLSFSWNLRVRGSFAMNLSVSELEAPSSYGCEDARLEVVYFGFYSYICPNWAPVHLISTQFKVTFFFSYHGDTATINDTAASKNGNKYWTTISLQYQILDYRNVSLKRLLPASRLPVLYEDYNLRVQLNDLTLPHLMSIAPVAFVGEFPSGLTYVFALKAAMDYLTPVVARKNVACNDHQAEIIFYDGYSEILWQEFQPILNVWYCSENSDGNRGNLNTEEVRGSIGVLSTVLFLPKNVKYKSFYLLITWHVRRILPGVLRMRTIDLTSSENRTIHLHPRRRTALEVVDIVAPEGKFVRLRFSEIKYVRSRRRLVMYGAMCMDGIDIKDPLGVHMGPSSGLICSNSTDENIVKQSKSAGLTVGHIVTISLRQYWWRASISAIITVSADHCVGYINRLPEPGVPFLTEYLPRGVLYFGRTLALNDYRLNSMYSGGILIHFRRSPGVCARLQLVNFQLLGFYSTSISRNIYTTFLQFIITSDDLTSTSRYMIDLSTVSEDIQFQNISSQHTLRLFSWRRAFSQVISLHARPFDVEAYVAQIYIHFSLLTHAAGLVLQVSDGNMPPVCAIERREYRVHLHYEYLLGPCAYADVRSGGGFNIIVFKPYPNRHCCRLVGSITHTQENHGLLLFNFLELETLRPIRKDQWQL